MDTFFTLLAALLCLLTLSNAMPPGTVAAQCTVQVFGDLMQNGKGIRVSTYIPFPWMNHLYPATQTATASFGSEKASVNIHLPILGTQLLSRDIHIYFTADYRCRFDRVVLSHVKTSGMGTGKCFRILQRCGLETTTYGTVYIDMWCDVPIQTSYPSGVIKMNYIPWGPEVSC